MKGFVVYNLWLKIQDNLDSQWAMYSQIKGEMIDFFNKFYDFQPKQKFLSFDFTQHPKFADNINQFSFDFIQIFYHIKQSHPSNDIFTKKLYSRIISSAHLLEDFLDFHGAKNNKNWFYFRELTATVRHLGLAGYSQKHIANRIQFYLLENTDQFVKDCDLTHYFFTNTFRKVGEAICEESNRLNLMSPGKIEFELFPRMSTGDFLDYDMDEDYELSEEEYKQQKKNYVKLSSEFLKLARTFDKYTFNKVYSFSQLKELVPETINEVEIRKTRMVVHNLQSYFDSYVILGHNKEQDNQLKQLRGHVSVILHLLQIMGRLLHFYERHIHDIGSRETYKKVREQLKSLVDPKELLDRAINFGLYYVCFFLTSGKSVAQDILNQNIERSSITVPVPKENGFHLRPSLLVAKIVEYYAGKVELCVANKRFDACSVLELQWAGGLLRQENIPEVSFEGDARALDSIQALANINYAEDVMGQGIALPKELKEIIF